MFLANSEILHVKKVSERNYFGPIWIHRSILRAHRKLQPSFFAKIEFEWKNNFHVQEISLVDHFCSDSIQCVSLRSPWESWGPNLYWKKLSQTNDFGWEIASNLQQKTVTGHNPASWTAILEVLRSNIWWIVLDTKTPEQHKIKIKTSDFIFKSKQTILLYTIRTYLHLHSSHVCSKVSIHCCCPVT